MTESAWTISGSGGQPILGNSHMPDGMPRGVILIAHGFKGYKDYGMFPRIAQTVAERGYVAHRFNFSHSGMTNAVETFERPDLFEQDTWNRQIEDYRGVIDALAAGEIEGAGLPFVMFGHSRGGVSALLTAGRSADDPSLPQPAGVATAASPSTCNSFTEEQAAALLRDGFIESPSARTGQTLRVGKAYLQEQIDDPAGHDLPAMTSRIRVPLLIMHGTDDPTVPVSCAAALGEAARSATVMRIAGGDHVFNTPNPLPDDAPSSPQLEELLNAICEFADGLRA